MQPGQDSSHTPVLLAGLQVQPSEDIRHVLGHRPVGEHQPLGDLRIGQSLRHEPQHLLLEDSWSGARNLRHAAWSLALPWRRRSDLVSEVMARTAVEDLARRRVDSLSGGERMRVALARTRLMREPGLVVLDEPTAGGDESLSALVTGMLDEWVGAGAGVLVVTHDQRLVERAEHVIGLGDEPAA